MVRRYACQLLLGACQLTFGMFTFTFYELESSLRWSIQSGMREASKRDCEGKQCCCCPHFPRPSSGGENPPRKKAMPSRTPILFGRGKSPTQKKGGGGSSLPAHSQFRHALLSSPPKQGCYHMPMDSISMWSYTLYMSHMDEGSSLRWLSASQQRCNDVIGVNK